MPFYPVPAANTRHRATPNRENFIWTQKAAKQSSKLMENQSKIKKNWSLEASWDRLGGSWGALGLQGRQNGARTQVRAPQVQALFGNIFQDEDGICLKRHALLTKKHGTLKALCKCAIQWFKT